VPVSKNSVFVSDFISGRLFERLHDVLPFAEVFVGDYLQSLGVAIKLSFLGISRCFNAHIYLVKIKLCNLTFRRLYL